MAFFWIPLQSISALFAEIFWLDRNLFGGRPWGLAAKQIFSPPGRSTPCACEMGRGRHLGQRLPRLVDDQTRQPALLSTFPPPNCSPAAWQRLVGHFTLWHVAHRRHATCPAPGLDVRRALVGGSDSPLPGPCFTSKELKRCTRRLSGLFLAVWSTAASGPRVTWPPPLTWWAVFPPALMSSPVLLSPALALPCTSTCSSRWDTLPGRPQAHPYDPMWARAASTHTMRTSQVSQVCRVAGFAPPPRQAGSTALRGNKHRTRGKEVSTIHRKGQSLRRQGSPVK